VLERFGSAEDVRRLVELAKVTFGQVKLLAARAALILSEDLFVTSRELLETHDQPLVGLVVRTLRKRQPAKSAEVLHPYLHSANEAARVSIAAYFVETYSPAELEALLDRYTAEESSYYNVVCWIDRALYAPESLDRK